MWLAAARDAFIQNGLEAVRIQPLATALGLSRTSFYWFFKDRGQLLDALLYDWDLTNTSSLIGATEAYAETITEAVLNLIGIFLEDGPFEPGLDLAVRGWAHQSAEVALRVNVADETRLTAIRQMFTRFGFPSGAADVRARSVYLVQIGYIALQAREDMATRMSRIPDYVQTFTGKTPSQQELRRFHAQHTSSATGTGAGQPR